MYLGESGLKIKRRKQFRESQRNRRGQDGLSCPASPGAPWVQMYLTFPSILFLEPAI
jgi:hypothetical protein